MVTSLSLRGDRNNPNSQDVIAFDAATGRPVSRLRQLDRKTRVEELARMLGGQEITETTRKHAREMLAS